MTLIGRPRPLCWVDESGREGGYLTPVTRYGVVMLDGETVGIFSLNKDGKVTITLEKKNITVEEMLEMVSENGMSFSLVLNPED